MKTSEKYIDLIAQSEDENAKEKNAFANEDAKIHVASALLETQKALATAKKDLTLSKKAVPYNLQKEIDATVKVEELEETLKLGNKINEVRF